MKMPSRQKVYHITLYMPNNLTRTVTVKASSREVAESRAVKRTPGAIGVKRDN